MTPRLVRVDPRSEHKLFVEFANGEARLFDVSPYLDRGIFRELRDMAYFRRVRVIRGGVEWPHEQDFSTDTLYLAGLPLASRAESEVA